MGQKMTLGGLFARKKFVMLFSLLCGIIVWLIVSIQVSPVTSRTLTDVTIDFQLDSTTNETELKAFTGSEKKVKVTVSGKKYVLDSLSSESVSVVANMGDVTGSGTYTLELSGKKVGNADFSIVSVEPSNVTVVFDREVTKELPVKLNVVGATIASLDSETQSLVLENEFVNSDQSKVTVVGPSKELDKVDAAEAYVVVNKQLDESQQFEANIRLLDKEGNVIYDPDDQSITTINNAALSIATATVKANVYLQKSVPLLVQTKNAPTVQPTVKIYEVVDGVRQENEVTLVRIKGPKDKIQDVTFVTLSESIDYSTISPSSGTFSMNTTLQDSADVIYPDYKKANEVTFDVVVDSTGITNKSFNVPDENISVFVAQDGVTATLKSSLKGIVVVGPESSVSSVNAEDITAKITITENTNGTYVKEVVFKVNGHDDCWIYDTHEVTVEVS